MKADFEKGTKVCSRCKKELPIEMFYKDRSRVDSLHPVCKYCSMKRDCTFNGERKPKRGRSNFFKRDYELTKEQLKRRNFCRHRNDYKCENTNPHSILIWYDEKLNELNNELYNRIFVREYTRQRYCAIRGYVGRTNPSEHFLFDFDLEQMLKDNVYYNNNGKKKYITKWWDGEIRHWTVNDGIWKK